ncbi:MAG: helix-turn-helix domain-containing protein [Treponemataceae bacterium]|nr:helix-turn-helix domain-containing protein [Treponemataceae bacterium]
MDKDFRHNLRDELDFQCLTVKELSAKTGIAKSTLDCYLGARATMPPADIAVRIARALNVSVEFLVTGNERNAEKTPKEEMENQRREILADLPKLNKSALCYVHATVSAVLKVQDNI